MLSKELLLEKGFELNTYAEGKYYSLKIRDDETIQKVLVDDYTGDEESVILQLKEDFSEKIICIDCETWDLEDEEFLDTLNRL